MRLKVAFLVLLYNSYLQSGQKLRFFLRGSLFKKDPLCQRLCLSMNLVVLHVYTQNFNDKKGKWDSKNVCSINRKLNLFVIVFLFLSYFL